MDVDRLITELRAMDAQQRETDELRQREVAWWYWRDDIEDAMGLPRGALDSSSEPDGGQPPFPRLEGP